MNKRKRNEIAKIYIEAAELIDVDGVYTEGCCISIGWAVHFCNEIELDYRGLFRKMFGKYRRDNTYWWPISQTTSAKPTEPQRQQKEVTPRIIALCLMAELVKDGQFDDQIGNLPY